MGHAKLEMLLDCYLDDMQRAGCTDASAGTNRRGLSGAVERAGDTQAIE